MATASAWRRSTLYLQRWSSTRTTCTPIITPSSLDGLKKSTRRLALSSSSCASASADDVSETTAAPSATEPAAAKSNSAAAVRPRASNAGRRVKLTPVVVSQQHPPEQQSTTTTSRTRTTTTPRTTNTAPSSPATAIRPRAASPEEFQTSVLRRPVKPPVVAKKRRATATATVGDFIEKLQRQADERDNNKNIRNRHHNHHHHYPSPPPQYRRHGKKRYQSPVPVPTSCWVQVDGIYPLSSLDAILTSVHTALEMEQEERGGILDLDSRDWDPNSGELPPTLVLNNDDDTLGDENGSSDSPWVVRAKVILSPFARPTGWHLKFRNRSIVYALLTHAQDNPIMSGSKVIKLKEWKDYPKDEEEENKEEPMVTDATLRVETGSEATTAFDLVNTFSRFDLAVRASSPSVVEWKGQTVDGKVVSPPGTFLLHFADASWARAALREKQGMEFKGRELRLAQYPHQIL